MGILIKHGGSVGATALGAYGGSQGTRQAQDTRQASATMARERQAKLQREAQEKQIKAQRELQASEAEKSRGFRQKPAPT